MMVHSRIRALVAGVAVVSLLAVSGVRAGVQRGHGHENEPAESAPATVAGTWNMSLHGDHVVPVALVLEQDGTTVTGTLTIMEKDVPLDGKFVDNRLALTGKAQVGGHGGEATTPMKIEGVLKEDGTLEGEFATARGPMKWTAERLRTRG